ncbi:SDR family NAD(P)-dependent oxidoreductase [Angustibacter aerolatus]
MTTGWALVTGATSGLGLAFARRLAADGHDVVLVARDVERLEAVAHELRTVHRRDVELLPADLTDRAALQRVADRLGDPGRPVEVVVNNAGASLGHAFLAGPVEESERSLDLLVRAVLVLSHAAATAMRERGRGAIVNVSSVSGWAVMGPYSASKSWVTVFSEGLAGEVGPDGVRVLALAPGFVRTEFHQRAGMTMSMVPSWGWLDADRVVDECLRDLRAGRLVSVPSRRWTVLATLLRVLPRATVRAGTGRFQRARATDVPG